MENHTAEARDALLTKHGFSRDAHRIYVCNATTGHFYRPVAFAENDDYARILVHRANVHDDMLAALREIEWLFDGKADITDNGGPNDAMSALAIARAAIAKATGNA